MREDYEKSERYSGTREMTRAERIDLDINEALNNHFNQTRKGDVEAFANTLEQVCDAHATGAELERARDNILKRTYRTGADMIIAAADTVLREGDKQRAERYIRVVEKIASKEGMEDLYKRVEILKNLNEYV